MKAAFVDRDGTIFEDKGYPRDPNTVELIPGSAEALRLLRKKGYLLFVVSNQSGVGRGIIQDHEFKAVHARCCELLQSEGVEIEEFGYCFHLPEDDCQCRKPNPGLITRVCRGEKIELSKCFTVGDRRCDLFLAKGIGAKGFLVLTGVGKETVKELEAENPGQAYPVYANLLEVAKNIPE